MHRPLHSRGAGSSQRDAEAGRSGGGEARVAHAFYAFSSLSEVPFHTRKSESIYHCDFYKYYHKLFQNFKMLIMR